VQPEQKARLLAALKEDVRHVCCDVPLARHTSFRIGGPGDVFVEPDTLDELRAVVSAVRAEQLPLFLLGGGTNLLISDNGVRGIVVKLGGGFNYAEWQEQDEQDEQKVLAQVRQVRVGAGHSLGRFVREAVRKGYAGVEFAEGIPGSIGGGLLMNAGAFGGELSQVVESIQGVDQAGQVVSLAGDSLGFAYRRTGLPAGFIVTEIVLTLRRQRADCLTAAMQQAQAKRHKGQPHGYPNAGSIFKNPSGTYAGHLIEAAGLKGTVCGQAQVSPQHANFIVNTGGARAADVKQLMEQVQRTVWATQQVWLEPEIRLVGDWPESEESQLASASRE
jgi:UDP-N-acetylmuramate dehydrogenase